MGWTEVLTCLSGLLPSQYQMARLANPPTKMRAIVIKLYKSRFDMVQTSFCQDSWKQINKDTDDGHRPQNEDRHQTSEHSHQRPPSPQPDAGLFFTLSVYRNPRPSNLQIQPVNLQFCKVEGNRGRKKKHLEILGVFKCLHRTFKHWGR